MSGWLRACINFGRKGESADANNGLQSSHCDTTGNSLEGGRTVGRKRRQLKHFSCPGRTAGWWRRHRKATAGLEPAGADEGRPGFGPGWTSGWGAAALGHGGRTEPQRDQETRKRAFFSVL